MALPNSMFGYRLLFGRDSIASIKSLSINKKVSSIVALLNNSSRGELISGVSVISGSSPNVCNNLKYNKALKNFASPKSLFFNSLSKSSNGCILLIA